MNLRHWYETDLMSDLFHGQRLFPNRLAENHYFLKHLSKFHRHQNECHQLDYRNHLGQDLPSNVPKPHFDCQMDLNLALDNKWGLDHYDFALPMKKQYPH